MLTLDCTRGGVIFPVESENFFLACKKIEKAFQAVNHKKERSFWLIPFIVPQSVNEGFTSALEGEAKRVRGEVEKILKNGPESNP